MINVDDKAPNFALKDQNDNEVSLGQYRGKPVLLAFFPFAWSPVCTTEMSCFRDDMSQLSKIGIQVLGISVDSEWTLKAWAENLGVDFPLLSDFGKKVTKTYGTLRADGFSDRAYFLIDKHGVVKWKHTMPKPSERLENEDILEEIRRL